MEVAMNMGTAIIHHGTVWMENADVFKSNDTCEKSKA
jgi:hypothetical protein